MGMRAHPHACHPTRHSRPMARAWCLTTAGGTSLRLRPSATDSSHTGRPGRARSRRSDPTTWARVPWRQPDRRTPLHVVPPTYTAPIPQLADSPQRGSHIELSNSAVIPHPPQGLTHEACAPDVHADLHAVITAWPTLSETIRATILRLIQEGGCSDDDTD